MNNLWILADVSANGTPAPAKITSEPTTGQTTTSALTSAPNAPGQAPGAAKQGMQWQPIILMVAMFVLLYFMMFRGPRKKQQQQRQMIESLKKNDRVQTIGGILGTVLDVKDDEVTLKIDESNNTKIRVVAGAISKVFSEEKK